MKSYSLLTVGCVEQRCPYCSKPLDTFPAKALDCPDCGLRITVATRPSDDARVLLTEEERSFVGGRWKPAKPNERETWIRRNPANPTERNAYFATLHEREIASIADARALGIDVGATISAGSWSCEVSHALKDVEFGPTDLPQLPLNGCPFNPHCFCCYLPRVHDRTSRDDRPQAEKMRSSMRCLRQCHQPRLQKSFAYSMLLSQALVCHHIGRPADAEAVANI